MKTTYNKYKKKKINFILSFINEKAYSLCKHIHKHLS